MSMLSVEEARARILEATVPLPAESHFLGECWGRVLAEDIPSLRNLPPQDNSAMDGYGVIASDLEGASEDKPIQLEVVGAVLAGDSVRDRPALKSGQAVRIMTGAFVPAGVDAVVMREMTDESGVSDEGKGKVLVKTAPSPKANIRFRGEDVAEGDVVGRAGEEIGPARINLIASAGHVVVRVVRRPVVAILASGDELKELGTPASDEDIINSNAHALAAAVRSAGAIPQMMGIAKDTLEDHVRRIEAATFADVLLTIGGVSVGTHDFVRPAMGAAGAELDFWKVAQRPGKPLAFGRRGEQLVFGLPGNPVSSLVTFELFVRPALRRLLGMKNVVRKPFKARLEGEAYRKKKGFTFHARARVTLEDGQLVCRVLPKQSSGQISGLAEANALCVIPRESEGVAAGDTVDVLLLDDALAFQPA